MLSRRILFTPLFLVISHAVLASPMPTAHTLTDAERSSLRYRLENIYNDVDLLVRNRRSDELDIQRQEQTARYLKIYERIPFQARLSEIRSQLASAAEENHLKIQSFRFLPRTADVKAVQANVHADEQGVHLSPDEIADRIHFRFIVAGDKDQVRTWIRGWPENIMRLLEPEGGVRSPILQPVGGGQWEVEAWAFRFRDIGYPRLRLRDPRALLPDWARRNPELFARQEPLLWNLVEKTEETGPRAGAFLPGRERFLLNDARISFFFLKAGATH